MEMSLSAADQQAIAGMIAEQLAEPLLYSVAAAAKVLDLSEPSVRRLVKEGKLVPFTGHGMNRLNFARAELERFVAGEPVPEAASPSSEPAPGPFRLVGVEGGELTYDGERATHWQARVQQHLAAVFAAADQD